MATSLPLTHFTQADTPAPNEVTQVVAHPVDTMVNPSVSGASQLASSLQDFMPHAAKYAEAVDTKAKTDAEEQGQKAGILDTDPVTAQSRIASLELPESVPAAYSTSFHKGYKHAIGASIGETANTDITQEYMKNRGAEGFNLESFISDFRGNQLNDVTDPDILNSLNTAVVKSTASIRAEHRAFVNKQLNADAVEQSQKIIVSSVTPNMNPSESHEAFTNNALPAILAMNVLTKAEAIDNYLEHVNNLSKANGGHPIDFEAFNIADAEGNTLANTNPAIADKVIKYQMAAQAQANSAIDDTQLIKNANNLGWINDQIDAGNYDAVSDDALQVFIGKNNVLSSDSAYQAIREKRNKAMAVQQDLQVVERAAGTGAAGMLPPEDQKKWINKRVEAETGAIMSALSTKNPDAINLAKRAVESIIYKHTESGTNVSADVMAGLFKSNKTSIPKLEADGSVPLRFKIAAQAYSQFKSSNNSTLLDSYMDEDTQQLFATYEQSRTMGGASEADAYLNSYKAISPETRAQAKEVTSTPEFKEMRGNIVSKILTDWTPVWGFDSNSDGVPFNAGSISNLGQMNSLATAELNRWFTTSADPSAMLGDEKAIKEHLNAWSERNFVYNSANGSYTQIPPNTKDLNTHLAVSAVTQGLITKYGEDAGVVLHYKGNGVYQPLALNGNHNIGLPITMKTIKENYYASKHLVGDELITASNLRSKAASGTLTQTDLATNAPLIEKIKSIGLWDTKLLSKSPELKGLLKAEKDSKKGLPFMSSSPDTNYKGVETSNLPHSAEKTSISTKFLAKGDYSGSLTALSEGVVLKATKGLADSEGNNIGLGYNIQRNASTYVSDFTRAGIPPESIPQIVSGERSITEEQAMRLYSVVQPRYESMAQKAYDTMNPQSAMRPAWNTLPPQVKAVLTDIAYQSGDSVLKSSRGKHAMVMMGDRDYKAGMEKLKVFYKVNGVDTFDEGRHNKRIAMLNNPEGFGSVINYVGKKPPTALAAKLSQLN